jgi:glycosyltransferase involved in cell wall biosynthesis
MSEQNAVWVTWENQRRSVELAKAFDAKLFMYTVKHTSRIARYLCAWKETLGFVKRENPKYLFAQNPSLILALLLCLTKPFLHYKLIIDRHSNFRYGSTNPYLDAVFHLISDYTIRKADYTIVTNQPLQELIQSKGGTGVVLQDKLPQMTLCEKLELDGELNLVLINSFSSDEPIDEVLEAMKTMPDQVSLYVTGDYASRQKYAEMAQSGPGNIRFTGFLPEDRFQSLLYSADALLVLTRSENTLTCGAYEGVALGKPLVLSDTKAIRNYFTDGAVYCGSDAESIHRSLEICLANREKLAGDILRFREKALTDWQDRFECVCRTIYGR